MSYSIIRFSTSSYSLPNIDKIYKKTRNLSYEDTKEYFFSNLYFEMSDTFSKNMNKTLEQEHMFKQKASTFFSIFFRKSRLQGMAACLSACLSVLQSIYFSLPLSLFLGPRRQQTVLLNNQQQAVPSKIPKGIPWGPRYPRVPQGIPWGPGVPCVILFIADWYGRSIIKRADQS